MCLRLSTKAYLLIFVGVIALLNFTFFYVERDLGDGDGQGHSNESVQSLKSLSVALLIMEGGLRQGLNGAVLSVLNNTPSNWPLYVILPGEELLPGTRAGLLEMSFMKVVKAQQRPLVLRDMPKKYFRQSQNVAAADISFWESFPEDWILLFQADSSMCSHPTIRLIDFFQFDYVGAPWKQYDPDDYHGFGAPYRDTRVFVGNGGFSLRRKEWMTYCLRKMKFSPPEDTFFALCTEKYGRPASTYQAMKFSSEQIKTKGGALAIHGICATRFPWGCNKAWVKKWLETCPESSFLFFQNKCPHCLPFDDPDDN